ncbi:hypothetical protein LTR99_005737 [Exophiala xenobiotica]|nr:hypothetical protein LTR99_005737 [Exophiala xenobiotica]KAK5340474.1 hypothetical protein LTR98_003596 [Exophiala xenobiotica]KAK5430972.1 hypothetical protein LTR34_005531 [Exophiala xenobiotica]KAK5450451.1 hypothetical protein LTR18_000467 [Exophiala xenobiotica]KAK5549318.1 hypothetical protein LTR23_000426 [Chaetothyriales sp. CCFEE 6169]
MSTSAFNDTSLSAPLSKLSSDDNGPWVIVAAYIFLVLSLMTIFIKLFTRFKATNHLTLNDCFILTAAFFALGQTITITVAENYGLGKKRSKVSDADFETFEKVIPTVPPLRSALMLIKRLGNVRCKYLASRSPRCLPGITHFPGHRNQPDKETAHLMLLHSRVSGGLDTIHNNTCVDRFALNVGIYSFNILGDVLIVIVPFAMMQKVQVSASRRFVVSALFSSRLSVPAFTIAYLVFKRRELTSGRDDPTRSALVPQVFAQIMMNVSIIAACIPSLKPFLADIKPGLIVVNIPEHELTASFVRHSRSRSESKVKSHGLSKLASRLGITSRGMSTLNTSSGNSGLWAEKQREAVNTMERGYNRPNATKASSKVENDRSESVKGLTDDIILHTIDYKVEYEDHHSDPYAVNDGSSGSPRRERM